jgi:hypothetical protein
LGLAATLATARRNGIGAAGMISLRFKKYLDQALKVLNPTEPPAVETFYSYGLARKINAELDAAG